MNKLIWLNLLMIIMGITACSSGEEKIVIVRDWPGGELNTSLVKEKETSKKLKKKVDSEDNGLVDNTGAGSARFTRDKVQSEIHTEYNKYYSIVESSTNSAVSFQVSGRVKKLYVREGQKIEAGQIIAEISDLSFKNSLASLKDKKSSLKSQYKYVHESLKRMEKLYKEKAVTQNVIEELRSKEKSMSFELSSLSNQLSERERLMSETKLYAPYDGTVISVNIKKGEMVSPGKPAITMADGNSLEIPIYVTEEIVNKINIGSDVIVSIPSIGLKRGVKKIKSVSRTAEKSSNLFKVTISIATDKMLYQGSSAVVEVPIWSGDAFNVAVTAVLNQASEYPFLFIYRDGVILKVEIKILDIQGKRILFISKNRDMSDGDLVVTSGHQYLFESGDDSE